MKSDHILSALRDRILNSEYSTSKTKIKAGIITNLICPECGKRTAWAYSEEPNSINCNRLNNCGARIPSRELFPEICRDIEQQFPKTKKDPKAPATAFLKLRGIQSSLENLKYEYWTNVRKTGSGAVMFPLANGAGKTVYNGRLFNPSKGQGKTHNQGSTAGACWMHPGIEYDLSKETYVAEGILDALSLIEMGLQAIAVISSGQAASKIDLSEYRELVLCFDNDPAGHSALKKWKEVYPKAEAMMFPKGTDANDFLLQNRRDNAGEKLKERFSEFVFNAKLALSKTASEYAKTYRNYKDGYSPGLFIFNDCYYFDYGKKDKDPEVSSVSNFTLKVDHFQLKADDPDRPEHSFHLIVKPRKGRKSSFTASSGEIASEQALRSLFLQRGGNLLFTGSRPAAMALLTRITESRAPVIRQLDMIGHDEQTGCYVFPSFLIDNNGKILEPNENGIFKVSHRDYIRGVRAELGALNPIPGANPESIFGLIHDAWGYRGLTALSWAVASWFVNEIKGRVGFFPILSLYGDTQTGKSWLTKTLNGCQCIKGEGYAMRKANTNKGEFRTLAQRACLFLALLEESGDGKKSGFDYRAVLTMYNDSPLYTTAKKTTDNQTNSIEFKGAAAFVQNVEPFKERAEKERVISLKFTQDQLTPETTRAFEILADCTQAKLGVFYQTVMKHHPYIKQVWHGEYLTAMNDLTEGIPDRRIRENHSVVLAFSRIVQTLLFKEQKYDLLPYIQQAGQLKIDACEAGEPGLADIFFDSIREEIGKPDVRHIEINGGRLYIQLTKALSRMEIRLNPKELYPELKQSPFYVTHRHNFRFLDGATKGEPQKAWVFKSDVLK